MTEEIRCDQCDRRAYGRFGDGPPLCMEHMREHQRMMHAALEVNAAQYNVISQMISESLGGLVPARRLVIPPYPEASGDVVNHINITGGNVGVINTGTVTNLNNTLTVLGGGGRAELVKAAESFAQSLYDSELPPETKNEVADQLVFLLEQTAAPAEQRRVGVFRSTLSAVGETVQSLSALASLWQVLHPLLQAAMS